jgi:hypothetical protein
MAGLKEFYCRSNETSLGSQFKWLKYTFNCSFPYLFYEANREEGPYPSENQY